MSAMGAPVGSAWASPGARRPATATSPGARPAPLPAHDRGDRGDRGALAAGGVVAAVFLGAAAGVLPFAAALAIATVLGFALAIAGVRRPALGLLGVVVLCVLDSPSRVFLFTGGLWRWNTFNYWLLLFTVLQAPLLLRVGRQRLFLVFLALLGAGLLLSADVPAGVQHMLAASAVIGLLAYFLRACAEPRVLLRAALLGGTTGLVLGLAFYLRRDGLAYINPNAWAFAPLTAMFAVCLGFASARGALGRLTLVALATGNLMWVFLSGSRGTLIVALCCTAFLVLSLPGLGTRTLAVVVGALLAVGVLSSFGDLQATTMHRIDKVLNSREAGRTMSLSERSSGRSDLALGGWYIFVDNPLGVGTGGFPDAWSRLRRREGLTSFGRGEHKNAHAGWIKVLAENGVPGIVALVAWVASFTTAGWRTHDPAARRLGILTSVALAASLLFTEFEAKGLWLLAAGAIAAAVRAGEAGSRRRPSAPAR